MARKLSWLVTWSVCGALCAATTVARAQVEARQNGGSPQLIQNRFVNDAANPTATSSNLPNQATADSSQLPTARSSPAPRNANPSAASNATFWNPFESGAKGPPLSIPLRPGPVSRWRRGGLPDGGFGAANAYLSTSSDGFAAYPETDSTNQANTNWDRLPPTEELARRRAVRPASIAVPLDVTTGSPPDPIGFAPQLPGTPKWMLLDNFSIPDASSPSPDDPSPVSATDPFDASNAAPTSEWRATPKEQVPAASAVGAPLSGSNLLLNYPNALSATASDLLQAPDMLPVIVSDYVDTSDGWLAKAESAAEAAQSIEELATVVARCEQGLKTGPDATTATALRRLAAWAHTRRGELLAEAGQTLLAFAEFEAALRLDANSSLALHNRAVTYAQQNRAEDALRDFGRVIELNPGLAVAYRNRGELLATLRRWQDAIADYDRALVQLPDDVDLYGARAEAWQRLGDFDRSLADINEALRVAPETARVYVQRGGLNAERGDYRSAESDYQRAIELAPDQVDGYRGLAWLLATCPDPQLRDPEQAVDTAKRGLALKQNADPQLLDALAAAHASAGQFELAIGAAQQALAGLPAEFAAPIQQRLELYQSGQPFIENSPAGQVMPASFEAQLPSRN